MVKGNVGLLHGVTLVLLSGLVGCGDDDGGEVTDAGSDSSSAGAYGGACRQDIPNCDTGLACDWRDGTCDFDCRNDARSCFAPFICQLNDLTEGYMCQDPGTPPECRGTPEDQKVPFATTSSDIPIRWDLDGGCVSVTYESTVADVVDRIRSAHEAWSAVSCSGLCFGEPSQNEQRPDIYRGESRVHWMTGASPTEQILTTLYFTNSTGRSIAAEVMLQDDAQSRSEFTAQAFLYAVGITCSLTGTTDGSADSVMVTPQPPGGGSRTELGEDDETALCTLYGTPGYCQQ